MNEEENLIEQTAKAIEQMNPKDYYAERWAKRELFREMEKYRFSWVDIDIARAREKLIARHKWDF